MDKPPRFRSKTHRVTWWCAIKFWLKTRSWNRVATSYYEVDPDDPDYEIAPYELGIVESNFSMRLPVKWLPPK
jgi:hypothetical protein